MMAASTATSAIILRLPISAIRAFSLSAPPIRRHTRMCRGSALAPAAASGLRQAHARLAVLVRMRFETGRALLDLGAARPFAARRLHALLRLLVLLEVVAAQDRRDLLAGQRLVLEQRESHVVECLAVVEQEAARALVLF